MERIAGTIEFTLDGVFYNPKGAFTYNLGLPTRSSMIGSNGVNAGYSEEHKPPMIEGAIFDSIVIDKKTLMTAADVQVHLLLANGKRVALQDGFYAHEGDCDTEEGTIPIRFEGVSCEEIK